MLTIQSSSRGPNNIRYRIRALVAADSAVTRGGISVLLGIQRDIQVVATVRNEVEMLQSAATLQPDLVVMEYGILYQSCFQCVMDLRRLAPDVKVIVFLDSKGKLTPEPCFAAGVDSCVQKEQIPEGLVSEIQRLFPNSALRKVMQVENKA